jgi:acetoin utilization deacetylase AcuC-like enzyme
MSVPLLGIVHHPVFQEHAPTGSHPERAERLIAIEEALDPLRGRFHEVDARAADDEEILRVHSPDHLRSLQALQGKYARLDPDTYSAPRSLEIAKLAAGSTIELAQRVARGDLGSGFALVRPPGHHAERDRAMGFCLLNCVAVAPAALRAGAGVERVAIVDWDVHHGNGTQHLFESDPDVLFVSLHEFPFYPGTGALPEMGTGAGEGATMNLPLPAGCGDPVYGAAFATVVVPALAEFRPELILVSAGFDAHARDPLADMRVTSAGFAAMASALRTVADQVCGGRLVLALEGGYDLTALGESVAAVTEVLAAPETPSRSFPAPNEEGRTIVERLREAHRRHLGSVRPG